MPDMSNWTPAEKTEYVPFLAGIVQDIPISEEAINRLSPRVRTAVRDLLRADR